MTVYDTPYATPDEVRVVVSRGYASTSRSPANMDDSQFEQAIADAQAQVDGQMRTRYATPFDPVPDLIRSITIAIAGYMAVLNWRQEKELPETDPAVRRYNWAYHLMEEVRDGKVDLDAGDDGAPAPSVGAGFGTPVQPNGSVLFGLCDFNLGWSRGWGYW